MRLAVDTTKVNAEGETRKLGATTPEGQPAGEKYYEYVLIHTDDIMVASRRAGFGFESHGLISIFVFVIFVSRMFFSHTDVSCMLAFCLAKDLLHDIISRGK